MSHKPSSPTSSKSFTRLRRGFWWTPLMGLGLCLYPPVAMAADPEAATAVQSAITSIRGHDPRSFSEEQLDGLQKKLDRAWDTLLDHPKLAMPAIRDALQDEHEDDLFIVDLSHVLLYLDNKPGTMLEVSAWIQRANPNIYPPGYFRVASLFGARRCQECLPAVIRMLDLEDLADGIYEHALPVDLGLGLLFSLGPYGPSAESAVRQKLRAQNCIVRRNATNMLAFLLPADPVPQLVNMAEKDPCVDSRLAAWRALSVMNNPQLVPLARKQLAQALPEEEKSFIVSALANVYDPAAGALLRELVNGDDESIQRSISEEIENLEENLKRDIELIKNFGSSTQKKHSHAVKQLKRAIKKGFFEFEGSSFDLEAALKPEDLGLVNQARASVLRRRSDECLYEWEKLYLAATVARYVAEQ